MEFVSHASITSLCDPVSITEGPGYDNQLDVGYHAWDYERTVVVKVDGMSMTVVAESD